MINCNECLPSIEETLYNISQLLEATNGLLGILAVCSVICFVLCFIRFLSDCDKKNKKGCN